MNEPVGVIGLGLLGSALVDRLLTAGYDVHGYDIDSARREELVDRGGRAATDVSEVGGQCSLVVLSLPDASVSQNVARQLVSGHPGGLHVIDTTTGDPVTMQSLGDDLAAAGVGYLDTTVAGSSVQTRQGEALLLVGGDPQHIARCRDVLNAMAPRWLPVGGRGSGARMKLVVNLVLGLNRAALAEGLAFAGALGIDPALALDVLRQSPAASQVMATKGDKMVSRDFTPQARLRQHLKDVRLIVAAAATARTPFSELHAELLESLVADGFGDEDNSAVIRAFD